MASHGINQKNPSVPAVRNAKRQPNALASQAIRGGARIAPTLDPLSNIATARPRSRAGNHSATVLLAPGQLNPSPAPSKKRQIANVITEFASAVDMLASDHQTIARARPNRIPIRSITTPPISHMSA